MIKAGKGFSASRSLSWLNILDALGKIPTLPTVCSPETGRYRKVNYQKLRIGAGNRFNAAVVLEGGRARVPTAQDAAIELHVLLVGPELGSPRCFLSRTHRSGHCLQRKISMLSITLEWMCSQNRWCHIYITHVCNPMLLFKMVQLTQTWCCTSLIPTEAGGSEILSEFHDSQSYMERP